MINRIAHQMHQWIGKILDHGLVDFGLFTDQRKFNILPQLACEIPGDAGIFLEQPPDRLHPRFHHGVLQVRNQQIELAHRLIKGVQCLRIITPRQDIRPQAGQTVFRQTDFAGEVEHLIETLGNGLTVSWPDARYWIAMLGAVALAVVALIGSFGLVRKATEVETTRFE